MLKQLLLVGAGGATGSILRFAVSYLPLSKSLPFATFLINVAGSFAIGLVMGYCIREGTAANQWRLLLATGLCGGFTTFSAFSFENLQLLQNGKWLTCLAYICASIVFGIAASWLGLKTIH